MADLAVVALGIDATQMTTGAAQANRAIESVESRMQGAQKDIDRLNKKLAETGTQFAAFGDFVKRSIGGVSAAALIKAIAGVAFEGSKLGKEMLESSIKTQKTVEQMQQLKIGATDLTPKLRELGGVMDFALVQSAALATKDFVILEKQMDTIKAKIASEMAPGLQAAGQAMQNALRESEPEIRASARHISDALESVSPAFEKFLEYSARFTSFITGGALGGAVVRALTPDLSSAGSVSLGSVLGQGPGSVSISSVLAGASSVAPRGRPGGALAGGVVRARGRSVARDTLPDLPTSFDPIISPGMQHAFDLIVGMADAAAAAAKALRELPVVIDTVPDIFKRLELPFLAGTPAPPIAGGPIPGTTPATRIISEREARIQAAMGGVLEDFVFQITTARSTVSDAFKGLVLGISDTFAAEFAQAVQKSLSDAFIKPLASWMENALTEIFGGISVKGIGKALGTLGSLFVGLFAEGGTIPTGHWGLVGERGPEIAYAGGSPMHISPMSSGGGISIVNNFNISAPGGEVSARTQDQIADAAARGIERASRIRGAR